MRVLLIDDEPAANQALRSILDRAHPDIDVVATASTIREALRSIEEHQPELLFLDINLPDGLGFDLVRHLPAAPRPEIIFVTSETSYAIQAIKVAALGYLLKPVDAEDLSGAIRNATERIRQKGSEYRLRALLSNLETQDDSHQQISIPSDQGVEFVKAGDILYCEGVDGYTSIKIRGDGSRLSSYSIGEYRKMLEPYGFRAVHRSYVVNRLHVTGWRSGGELVLRNGETIPVSRRRRDGIRKWLRD